MVTAPELAGADLSSILGHSGGWAVEEEKGCKCPSRRGAIIPFHR